MLTRKSLLCGAAALGLYSGTALAETATPYLVAQAGTSVQATQTEGAAIAPRRNVVETIVVTAEKRSEDIQTVPISMSAITGDDLSRRSISDFQDLAARVPSLRFGSGLNGGEFQVVLRGLFNPNTTSGGDSPTTYSVDGVYLARTNLIDPEFFDIERVEVLRGPQGTLQGRNSLGGSINVITNKPTDELSGHVDALFGDYNARIFRGWANVPLYDCGDCKILARIAGVSAKHDAYQKNLSQAPGATSVGDSQDYQMLRGHLLFQFNADIDLLISASTARNTGPFANKVIGDFSVHPKYAGAILPTDPRKTYQNTPQSLLQWSDQVSATFNWDMGNAKFTSITGFMKAYIDQSGDVDGSDYSLAITDFRRSGFKQWSQEFRLASNDETSPLRWIAGLYYFREFVDRGFFYYEPGVFTYDNGGNINTTAIAPFGQIDFDLAKTNANIPLSFSLGLRYNYDKKWGNDFQFLTLWATNTTFTTRAIREKSWSEWTGKFSVQYQPTADLMFYGLVSRGYVSGGYLLGTFSGVNLSRYDPATAWNYEVGMKSEFFDNRLQFNVSAFRMEIDKMQVFILRGPVSTVDNAAQSHVNGIEAEMVAVPIDGLRLNAALSLLDAKFDQFVIDDNRTGIPNVDMSGNKLLQTPNYMLNIGAEYAFDLGTGTLTPRVDVFFSGAVWFLPVNNPLYDKQKPYSRTDLRLTWQDVRGKYTVDAFVKNLFDKDVISNLGVASRSMGGAIAPDPNLSYVSYYPPRTVGVRFGVNF